MSGRYRNDVSLELTERMITAGLLLLILTLGHGMYSHNYTLLRLLLLGGMYFIWILFFMGVIAILAPDIYEKLEDERGLIKYVMKAVIIAISALTLMLMLSLAGIPVLLNP